MSLFEPIDEWRFPLSGGRSVRLVFTGPALTVTQVDELLALLQLSRAAFAPAELLWPELHPATDEVLRPTKQGTWVPGK
jgi:hypothetical protein